ncbi:MAG TPA: acyltransferase family protein [Acidimicrobiia bacterium]
MDERAAVGGGAAVPHAPGFSYKPALDGLRAVAVLAVIAYHFGARWAPGGFLGVDLFFVLSGYLITSLLVIEWGRSNAIDLVAFWARRARRLLPALFLVLAAVAIWAALAAHHDQLNGIRSDSIWSLFYGANWHLVDTAQSYFATAREASPLRHMWSLAIEEQFYLVWPLVAFACLKLARGKRWLLGAVCVAGITASVLWMTRLFDHADQSRAYYGTDARAAQLLVGALLALVLAHSSPNDRLRTGGLRAAGAAGAVVCAWFFLDVSDTTAFMYRGGFLVFAVAAAAVVAAVVQPRGSALQGALALRPAVWIGTISYGLYLWHWPVVVAVTPDTLGRDGWQLSAVRLVLTFGLAALSFYLVEKPIRYGSSSRGRTGIALAAAGGFATALIVVVATSGGTAPPAYLVAAPEKALVRAAAAPPVAPQPTEAHLSISHILLVGDSVASSIGVALQDEAAAHGVQLDAVTRPGCGLTTATPLYDSGEPVPWGPVCAANTPAYEEQAVAATQPDVVLWFSSWETSDTVEDGVVAHFGTLEGDTALFRDLDAARARLTAGGARLVLVTVPPPADTSEVRPLRPDEGTRREHLDSLFWVYALRHPQDVAVVDLARIVCPPTDTGGCPATSPDGVVPRPRDGNHFEGDGPTWVAPRFYSAMIASLEQLGRLAEMDPAPLVNVGSVDRL